MLSASAQGRPAVEPLGVGLMGTFGDQVYGHRVRQMIGHMVRQIMEAQGFVVDRRGVRVRPANLFVKACTYRPKVNVYT